MLVVLATPAAANPQSGQATSGSTGTTLKSPQAYLGLGFRWRSSTTGDKFLHVENVVPNGPAHRAGVQPHDIITHLNGVPVGFGDELDFLIFMRERKAGERVVMTVVRSGKTLKIVTTLGALPAAALGDWEKGFKMAQQKRLAAQAKRR